MLKLKLRVRHSLWLVQGWKSLKLTRTWAFALRLRKITGQGIYKFLLAGKWSESVKMSCRAILKNMYEPKMDVILTISLKMTAGIQIRKHMFWVLLRRRGVLPFFSYIWKQKHNFSSIPATTFTLVGLAHQLLVRIEENSHFLNALKLYKFVNNKSKKALFCKRF